MARPEFWKLSSCEMGCNGLFDKDVTEGKLVYQNCTTTCAFTYETEAGNAFLACAMANSCVEFPPIPGSCPYKQEHIKPGSSLAAGSGEWWQQRGKNALWDCYDCQHIHEMKLVNDSDFCAKTVAPGGVVESPCWSYTYSHDLYLATGGTRTFEQTLQLPADTPEGERIDIYYSYMGSWHNESWFILDSTDTYWILGDCSYMQDWVIYGSILWVRPGHTLTATENAGIAKTYKEKLGWEFDDFCHDRHEGTCRLTPGDHNNNDDNNNPAAGKSETKPKNWYRARPGQRKPFVHPKDIEDYLQQQQQQQRMA
ncbi:unnamed protein product [Polarella glacialis]|uniref:VDE lipocalin domain-containing protein n=1 Tax=Polarella glacialis TaxID=89957 RepID=A0A813DC89_POLGL|nr:unnamed protein product [Polarella glacialis]